jgi:hypothetical protein
MVEKVKARLDPFSEEEIDRLLEATPEGTFQESDTDSTL